MKFISPKTDFTLKKIFGSIHSKSILISFLNAIVYNNQNVIQSLEIINPYNPGVTNTLKDTYLDVKAVLDNGSTLIIEMQMLDVDDFEKRVIYNLAKAYGNQLDVRQGYMMLTPFLALTIADFILFDKTDKMITKFRFKEDTELFNYQDELTLMFLELPKFTKELSELEILSDKWIYFMKSAPKLEVIPESLGQVPEIEAAFNMANMANFSNEELEVLEIQERLTRDKRGQISLARKQGIGIGIKIEIVKQILHQIRRDFGEIAPEVQGEIRLLSLEKLDTLGKEIYDLATMIDLKNCLAKGQVSEIEVALMIRNKVNLSNEELQELEKQKKLIKDKKREGKEIGREEGIGRLVKGLISRKFEEIAVEVQSHIEKLLIRDKKGQISLAKTEGIGIGIVKQTLRQIRRKFGEISPEVQTQIEQLSLEKLDILGEDIFDLATMIDLENWLANQQLIPIS